MERFSIGGTFNAGAIKWKGTYLLAARVEGSYRKSFFAVAESPNGIDNFRFWDYPITMPETDNPATNIYDMRLTAHEDSWIYGVFCVERKDPDTPAGDLSSAMAAAGIARTKDLVTWERLPDLKSKSQQRNVVWHTPHAELAAGHQLHTRRSGHDVLPAVGKTGKRNCGRIGKVTYLWTLNFKVTDLCPKVKITVNGQRRFITRLNQRTTLYTGRRKHISGTWKKWGVNCFASWASTTHSSTG
jgi:hypothetical protein